MCDSIANGGPRCPPAAPCPPANVTIASNVLNTNGNVIAGNVISVDGTFTGNLYIAGQVYGNIIYNSLNIGGVINTQTIVADAYFGNGYGLSNLNAGNLTGTIQSTNLPVTGVATGVYGDFANVSQVTVDVYGRVTQASNVGILSSQWTTVSGNVAYQNGVSVGTLSAPPVGSNLYVLGSANITDTLNVSTLFVNSATVFGSQTLNVFGVSNLAFITGDGGGISNVRSSVLVGNVASANVALVVSQPSQPNITSVGILTSLNVSGISNLNFISGNASGLSNINASNLVGNVANANVALVVSQPSQPNITSVGILTGLYSTGNVSASLFIGSGNLLSNIQVSNLTGILDYAKTAGSVINPSQPNITSVGALTSLSVTGSLIAGTISGDGQGLFGIHANAISETLATANSVVQPAQPNITSVGTLTGLAIQGLLIASNSSGLSNVPASNLIGTMPVGVLPVSGVTAGLYGSGANVSSVTVDQYGRVTNASNVPFTTSQWTTVDANVAFEHGVSIGIVSNPPIGSNLYVLGTASIEVINVGALNAFSANLITANVENLNVVAGEFTTQMNAFSANLITSNVGTLNASSTILVSGNVENLNVASGTLSTLNAFSANLITSNVGTLNVESGILSTLNAFSANLITANVATLNAFRANLVTANVGTLNVASGTLSTLNAFSANLITANVGTLNAVTGGFTSQMNAFSANLVTANVGTLNAFSSNLVTANVVTLNAVAGGFTTQMNAFSANLVTANVGTLNVASGTLSTLNAFSANLITANVGTMNVSSILVQNLNVVSNSNVSNLVVTSNILAGPAGNTYMTGNLVISGNVFSALGDPLGFGGSLYFSLGGQVTPSTYTGGLYGQALALSLSPFSIQGSSSAVLRSANGHLQFTRTGVYNFRGMFCTTADNITGVAIGSNVIDYGTRTDQTYVWRHVPFISQNPTAVFDFDFYVGSTTAYYYVDLFAVDAPTLQPTSNALGGTWLTVGPSSGGGGSGGSVTLTTLGACVFNASPGVSDYYVGVNNGTPITLPLGASLSPGKQYIIKDESGLAGTFVGYIVTVYASGSDLIDGQASFVIALNYGSVSVVWTGTRWSIF